MHRLIKRLQVQENYVLERCSRCGEVADKYLEFESNLKILSLLLITQSVYRHIYFNLNFDQRRGKRHDRWELATAAVSTIVLVLLVYWNCNREEVIASQAYVFGDSNSFAAAQLLVAEGIEPQLIGMHHIQRTNIKLIYTFNWRATLRTAIKMASLVTVFLFAYVFKWFQTGCFGRMITVRLWLCLVAS